MSNVFSTVVLIALMHDVSHLNARTLNDGMIAWSHSLLGGKQFQNGVSKRTTLQVRCRYSFFLGGRWISWKDFWKEKELFCRGEKRNYLKGVLCVEAETRGRTARDEEDAISTRRKEKWAIEYCVGLPFPSSLKKGWEEGSLLNLPNIIEDEVEAYMQQSTKATRQGKN